MNDGSTDGSRATLAKWRRRFPDNILVLDQENAGQAAARNTGLAQARGTWVTFIDPDDFIERNYFKSISQFVSKHDYNAYPLQLVSCNFIVYREAKRQFVNDHPLRFRFATDVAVPILDPGKFFQLSVNSALFRRAIVAAKGLRFDPRVKPSFEDGHFVARYVLACSTGRLGFARSPRYYYRKRADATSTLDTAKYECGRYDDIFRFAHIPLLDQASAMFGSIPRWLQRTVLYDVIWLVKDLLNQEEKLSFLTEAQLSTFREHLTSVLGRIDAEVFEKFELAGTSELHRVGLLGRFANRRPEQPRIHIEQTDLQQRTIVARWYSATEDSKVEFSSNGTTVPTLERKQRVHTLVGEPSAYECYARLPLGEGILTARLDHLQSQLVMGGIPASEKLDLASPLAFAVQKRASGNIPSHAHGLRARSRSPEIRAKYKNAWLLMDRDTQADDNGEHLYRYIAQHQPSRNIYFALRRTSHDWERLEAEGFRLIDFGSEDHRCALLNAEFLISSHVDRYVIDLLDRQHFGDLLNCKFVFLQHGVTQADLSSWLNQKVISLVIAATRAEYRSMADQQSRYKLLPSEVALTGFPRHDQLLVKGHTSRRVVLLMPTWRESLVGKPVGQSNQRSYNDAFRRSDFARTWRAILHSPRLKSLLKQYRFDAVFFPHANLQPYLDVFTVPEHIKVLRHSGAVSIQDLFAKSRVLVTDYSSVAFEMAYIDRSVIYYQFDRDAVFSGAHLTRKGYFDYERDGFGPVCLDEETLLDQLEATLKRDGEMEPVYARRAQETFAWRDGKNCERVVAAIERLNQPFERSPVETTEPEPQNEPQNVAWLKREAAE